MLASLYVVAPFSWQCFHSVPLIDFPVPQAVSYVELQTVRLRTIDGKEVAQLRCELNHECLWAAAPASNSVLFAPAATDDSGIASEADVKVGAPAT